ncbi:uncharacterized protein LOC135848911 isoform X1 [Planococcus citri]|uniref:uncharacterized protein LOC135848911 isoform X1 n=1 Tax=Planococcus citri TaxID=170843 RepID=UPI0031F75D3B
MKYCSFLLFCHIFVNFDRFNVVNIFCKCQSDLQYKDDDESERVFDEIRIVKKADPTYETSPYTMSVLNQSYHDQEEEEDRKARNLLIVYGFNASLKGSELRQSFLNLLTDLQLNMSNDDVLSIMRLRSRALNGSKSAKSPISVKVKSPETKQKILQGRFNIKGLGLPYTIETYLTKKLRDRQQLLFPLMQEFRKKGHHAVIHNAKLIVNGRMKIDANLDNFQVFLEQFKASRVNTRQKSKRVESRTNNKGFGFKKMDYFKTRRWD